VNSARLHAKRDVTPPNLKMRIDNDGYYSKKIYLYQKIKENAEGINAHENLRG
jgi:hypothetical protein